MQVSAALPASKKHAQVAFEGLCHVGYTYGAGESLSSFILSLSFCGHDGHTEHSVALSRLFGQIGRAHV